MPVINLRQQTKAYLGGVQQTGIWLNGTKIWAKLLSTVWTTIVPQNGGPNGAGSAFFRGNVTANGDGSYRVTTAAGSTNGRAYVDMPIMTEGTSITIDSSLQFNDATRIILRQVENNDSTGGLTIFDVTRTTGVTAINRTDTFNTVGNRRFLHYIGVSATGQYFTINQGTRWRLTNPPVAGAIDSVVVIGASLMFAMFGQNLSTPNSSATTLLANAGHSLPVYGYASNGATLADADTFYSAARAAHPNALILMHLGGNNVTNSRPYPGGTTDFNTQLSELLAVANGDQRFYPASITFRDYNDTTFQNPDAGSKPYNENIMLPWINTNFPNAMASYGRPKLDFYRRSLQSFETWLQADNVHMTTTGYNEFREWIVLRIADLLNGVTPPQISERVYAPPSSNTLSIVNFTSPIDGAGFQAPYNNLNTEAPTISQANIFDVSGTSTSVGVDVTFTGSPVIGSTSAPGRGRNTNGRTTGLSAYNGNLLSTNIVSGNLFITSGVTASVNFTGLAPDATYEIGMVGSRSATGARNTVITINDVVTTWDTSEDPPLERKATVTSSSTGTLSVVLSVGTATTYAYLGGLSIQRIT